MCSIIVNGIGLDSDHLYEFTVVNDGTTRKQQLERGSKIITEGSDLPYPKLSRFYDLPEPQMSMAVADEMKRIENDTHFTYEPLNVIEWRKGMKMWLLYDFGDEYHFVITCNNVVDGGLKEKVAY